jgi:hypothetical protein
MVASRFAWRGRREGETGDGEFQRVRGGADGSGLGPPDALAAPAYPSVFSASCTSLPSASPLYFAIHSFMKRPVSLPPW